MKKLRFLHISDCHFRESYEGWYLKGFDREDGLKKGLAELTARIPDMRPVPAFMIVSGDLTHEGEARDYEALRTALERGGIPVFAALGNHDRRDCFREGFLGERPSSEPYDFIASAAGLRVIVMDTSIPGFETGDIEEDRLAWLSRELARPAERGSILVLHHPPLLRGGVGLENGLPRPERLLKALDGSDVAGIFSGHTHRAKVGLFGPYPHVTAGSTAFGAETDGVWFSMNARTGFMDCGLDENGLSAAFEPCGAPLEYARTELANIMASMSKPK